MAGHGDLGSGASGPGNKVIATTLLEWLALRGSMPAQERVRRALAASNSDLMTAPRWLTRHAIALVLDAAEIDAGPARSMGHRLVSPDATGLRLYGLGLATPEKAYRRVQSLLPREDVEGQWTVSEIDDRKATLRYVPAPLPDTKKTKAAISRTQTSLCAFRTGMLEAVPGLYGLLPAEVTESECVAQGAQACCYSIRWKRTSRIWAIRGLLLGSLVVLAGAVAGLGLLPGLTAWLATTSLSVPGFVLSSFAFSLLSVAAGAVLDLRGQLEAVAGARRGHLALFDQVDDALAEKLDALARADATLDSDSGANPRVRAIGTATEVAEPDAPDASAILSAAQQIHTAAGDLECWFDAEHRSEDVDQLQSPRAQVREIREWAALIGQLDPAGESTPRSLVRPRDLVERAIASLRPSLPSAASIYIEAADGLPSIECESVSIEQVMIQLLRNAVEASVDLTAKPEVFVTLQRVSRGVEFSVEDRGVGIASTEVDEVFDPFFEDPLMGGGFGLSLCLRIVERHGGELRIEVEDREGTRVTMFLPDGYEADKEDG